MTLPSFLLAWADRNWVGRRSRLRPDKNARWSLARTLGRTALAGSIGALLGLGIAFASFHEPVGWMPWLLGLWFTCFGICWYGITALCWNQRARRLAENAALATGLPKARYVLVRWFLGLVYFLLVAIITPLALLTTVENLRGELAWRYTRSNLIAQGERLTIREILGPEIPADQNAGAAPIFAPFFDYGSEPPERGPYRRWSIPTVWHSSNELARLETRLRLPPETYLPKHDQDLALAPKRAVDVAAWSAAYRQLVAKPSEEDQAQAAELKLPAPGDPARDVLAGIASADQELGAICAAAALPRSQFPLHQDEGPFTLLRHLARMKAVQQMLRLSCAAHLATGQTNAAFADVTNAVNVAELLREEPILISQLVRYAQLSIALDTLWQGFPEHRWTDAQLASVQERFGRIELLTGFVHCMEGERAWGITGMEQIPDIVGMSDGPESDSSLRRSLQIPLLRTWLRQNQVTLVLYYQTFLPGLRAKLASISSGEQARMPDSLGEAPLDNLLRRPYSPYTVLTAMLAPALDKAGQRVNKIQSTLQMAVIACGLERYHLAHGRFPETLDELTPRYIATVPKDLMSGQPFHYRRTEDGWFLLYSVGPNGTDDGGVFKGTGKEEKDWPWPVPSQAKGPHLF